MELLEALKARKVTRAFSDKAISDESLRDLLKVAINAPSGSNIQPWEVYLTNGTKTKDLCRFIDETVAKGKRTFGASYSGKVPDRFTKRSAELFSQLNPYLIEMGTKGDYILNGSLRFFNAPAVAFVYIHESPSPLRLPCIGSFIVYLMLTAQAYGLVGSCPIGYIRGVDDVIRGFWGVPEDLRFIISIAVGYPEEEVPINRFKSGRVPVDENCRILS
jgi:nitroreductase